MNIKFSFIVAADARIDCLEEWKSNEMVLGSATSKRGNEISKIISARIGHNTFPSGDTCSIINHVDFPNVTEPTMCSFNSVSQSVLKSDKFYSTQTAGGSVDNDTIIAGSNFPVKRNSIPTLCF